jgi:hypothetical protein
VLGYRQNLVLATVHWKGVFLDWKGFLTFFFPFTADSCEDGESSSSSSKSKTKRVRTTFSDEQLAVLQANFQLDSNPDGQVRTVNVKESRLEQILFFSELFNINPIF